MGKNAATTISNSPFMMNLKFINFLNKSKFLHMKNGFCQFIVIHKNSWKSGDISEIFAVIEFMLLKQKNMMSKHRNSKIDFRSYKYVAKTNCWGKVIFMMLKHIFMIQRHIKLYSLFNRVLTSNYTPNIFHFDCVVERAIFNRLCIGDEGFHWINWNSTMGVKQTM
jgi:hypothetical protein